MRKVNVVGVASGVITVALALVGGPWWVAVGGEAGQAFHAGISPFAFDIAILGNPLIIPVVTWINLAARIAFILAGVEITVASLFLQKAWSKRFISLRALWTSLVFVISIFIALQVVHSMVGIAIPLFGDARLTYTLPIQDLTVTAEVPTQTYFTLTFELALVSGILAIVARMIHGRLIPTAAPPTTEVTHPPVSKTPHEQTTTRIRLPWKTPTGDYPPCAVHSGPLKDVAPWVRTGG